MMLPDRLLFLCPTDTTVGFVSRDPDRIDRAKHRHGGKPYLTTLLFFRDLPHRVRVPRAHKKRLRRSRKVSYILPGGYSFRKVELQSNHALLLRRLKSAYSSSANLSRRPFDEEYARSVADVIVEPLGPVAPASKIYRLGKRSLRRIR